MRPATKPAPPKKPAAQLGSGPTGHLRMVVGLYGCFLGLALLKFGNPPIMEKYVTPPVDVHALLVYLNRRFLHGESSLTAPHFDLFEVVLGYPWPLSWAYALLILLAALLLLPLLFGKRAMLFKEAFAVLGSRLVPSELPESKKPDSELVSPRADTLARILLVLPLAWFAWQLLAATQSLDPQLSRLTLSYFAACGACFYFGFVVVARFKGPSWFWGGLFGAFALVLAIGWEQHFGGLEESRRYFFMYVYPDMKQPPPPEYLKRILSTRIFGTLFYPNALAGALLLLLPLSFGLLASTKRFTLAAKSFLIVVLSAAALACLYWSGSKGGWLLMLLLGLLTLFRLPFARRLKLASATVILILGLAGFLWKYSAFFQRGATSVSARFDYWRAALQTALQNPIVGTGPGTFAIPYARIKRPESEMSRLVHNDYLEQASDSGLPGLLLYLGLSLGILGLSFSSVHKPQPCLQVMKPGSSGSNDAGKGFHDQSLVTSAPITFHDFLTRAKLGGEPSVTWFPFAVWLGVLGWSLQALLEFPLYIPALAWPAFTFMGWLLAFCSGSRRN